MPSVVIAAHDEEAVIGRCLDALAVQREISSLEVVVSANGCHDRTAEVAASRGVAVVDREEPGKAAALNAGEAVVTEFPRIFLDADIIVPPHAISALAARLAKGDRALVAVPRRRVSLSGRPWPVRAYFSINENLPAFRSGLFGRGMIAVSQAGRGRFAAFPELIADDLFLDSQFADHEKCEVAEVEVVIEAPYTTRALLRRLVRVRRGNTEMRSAHPDRTRQSDPWAWYRDVVRPNPRLMIAAIPYVTITLLANILARRHPATNDAWGQDASTRNVDGTSAARSGNTAAHVAPIEGRESE